MLGVLTHTGDFVQSLHVHNSHWSVVSNIRCEDGVVKYYDSMYPVSLQTMQLIASLVFSPTSELEVRIMDVGQQTNGSDCGVLAIDFAFDICCGKDPCSVRFDHIYKASLGQVLGGHKVYLLSYTQRNSSGIKCVQKTELHCCCRLPEKVGVDQMAECEVCMVWYCMDIPSEVFDNPDLPWKCKITIGYCGKMINEVKSAWVDIHKNRRNMFLIASASLLSRLHSSLLKSSRIDFKGWGCHF